MLSLSYPYTPAICNWSNIWVHSFVYMGPFHAAESDSIVRTALQTPSGELHFIHQYYVCIKEQKIGSPVENLLKTKTWELMGQKHKSWILSLNLKMLYKYWFYLGGVWRPKTAEWLKISVLRSQKEFGTKDWPGINWPGVYLLSAALKGTKLVMNLTVAAVAANSHHEL